MTRDQIVAVYESSDQSFNASMECLGQGPTLESILFMLNVKMRSAEQVKLVLDPDDMADYYKSSRIDTRKQLHIKINNMAAIEQKVYAVKYTLQFLMTFIIISTSNCSLARQTALVQYALQKPDPLGYSKY